MSDLRNLAKATISSLKGKSPQEAEATLLDTFHRLLYIPLDNVSTMSDASGTYLTGNVGGQGRIFPLGDIPLALGTAFERNGQTYFIASLRLPQEAGQ